MIKRNQIARDVRVVLNDTFEVKCLGDKYLKLEPELYIRDEHIYNDTFGEYVFIDSEYMPTLSSEHILTGVNSGYAYLNELDLKYPVIKP